MNINKHFLKSRVARHIFFLFIFCTLLPLFIMAGITYTSVNTQLTHQAKARLRQSCKIKGLEIYNKLASLEMELKMVASVLKNQTENLDNSPFFLFKNELKNNFRNMALSKNDGQIITNILGTIETIPVLSSAERHHVNIGRTLVLTPHGNDKAQTHRILMVRLIIPEDAGSELLVAEVNPFFLWGVDPEEALSWDIPLFILHPNNELLFSTIPNFQFKKDALDHISANPIWGDFEFHHDGEVLIAGYWSLFLNYHFLAPAWIVIMGQAKSIVQDPTVFFTRIFFLLVLLTFLIVSLLSIILIRKNLVPIESLRVGTEKIAKGEFGAEVQIKSGDEFEALGDAFNEMSRKLEEGRRLLVQSAKMGAVGQMAAGIVHEIGQPLTSFFGLIDLMLLQNPNDEIKRDLEMMKRQTERLGNIISRFKNFARVSEEKMVPVSLNEVIEMTYELLAHQIQMRRISWKFEKGDAIPRVLADSNMLQQVITNLVINAMDAFEGKTDGQFEICVRTHGKNHHVFVEIEDNGMGIPEKIQEHIFDPFFTTKGKGKGTGLGLAIITSILHQHGAEISLESKEGQGTKFILCFSALE